MPPGVKGALVTLTADKKAAAAAPAARPAPNPPHGHAGHDHGAHAPQQPPRAGKIGVPGIGAIIAADNIVRDHMVLVVKVCPMRLFYLFLSDLFEFSNGLYFRVNKIP